jgi:transcriptional regulator with XRE-family HTH domain
VNLPLLVALKASGLRGYLVAAACGITPSHFSNILQGRTRPSSALRERIASVLDRAPDDLFPESIGNERAGVA